MSHRMGFRKLVIKKYIIFLHLHFNVKTAQCGIAELTFVHKLLFKTVFQICFVISFPHQIEIFNVE